MNTKAGLHRALTAAREEIARLQQCRADLAKEQARRMKAERELAEAKAKPAVVVNTDSEVAQLRAEIDMLKRELGRK